MLEVLELRVYIEFETAVRLDGVLELFFQLNDKQLQGFHELKITGVLNYARHLVYRFP